MKRISFEKTCENFENIELLKLFIKCFNSSQFTFPDMDLYIYIYFSNTFRYTPGPPVHYLELYQVTLVLSAFEISLQIYKKTYTLKFCIKIPDKKLYLGLIEFHNSSSSVFCTIFKTIIF